MWLRTSVKEAFEALSNPARWPQLFPWIHKVTVDNTKAVVPNGRGAKRTCYFGNGLMLEEVIVGWEPPHRYAYAGVDETHPFGMVGHVALVVCKPAASGLTHVRWQHFFDHPNPTMMAKPLEANLETAVCNLIDHYGGHRSQENRK
ncbi:MAG: SRPBCC family protein [Chloroflexota bacterium]